MTRLTCAIVAMLLAFPMPCFADLKDTFLIPDVTANTVRLKSYDANIATLAGAMVLSARYDIGWLYEGEMPLNAIAVRLTPIDTQWQLLPRFKGQPFPPFLNVSNVEQAIRLLLEPRLASSLERKEIKRVSGSAQIVIRDIRVGVECGQTWYDIAIERMIQPIDPAEMKSDGLSPTC